MKRIKPTLNKKDSPIIFLKQLKEKLSAKYNIKIEYLEIRNAIDLNKKQLDKKFRLFVAYYINNIRLIDNF